MEGSWPTTPLLAAVVLKKQRPLQQTKLPTTAVVALFEAIPCLGRLVVPKKGVEDNNGGWGLGTGVQSAVSAPGPMSLAALVPVRPALGTERRTSGVKPRPSRTKRNIHAQGQRMGNGSAWRSDCGRQLNDGGWGDERRRVLNQQEMKTRDVRCGSLVLPP